MSDMKNGVRNNRLPDAAEGKRIRYFREAAIGLLSAAVFVALFYLWGEELLPRAAGRLGKIFPFVGAVALTMAVALFLTEWFGFAGREVRKVRLAARDFLFLCTLSLVLFFLAKWVVELLPAESAWNRAVPARLYVYLIPLPAFAMIVRILLNSEVAILFTVAASVLSAAAAFGRWPALLFLLISGTAAAARSGRIGRAHV
jgi:membrane-associated HD superfamily phosphohydrolase